MTLTLRLARLLGVLAACGVLLLPLTGQAQTIATRSVTMIVAFPPGGTPDILARLLSDKLGEATGQSFVVDNRPGAGGNIGGQAVARAAPDGATLLVCAFSCATSRSLYTRPAYDIERDMAPIILLGTVPSVLVVPAALPARSLQELIALARRDSLHYASSGVGSSPHFAGELLNQIAGIEVTHVPYRGAGQVAADLLAGRVQLYFENLPAALPNIRSGRLRALLVAQTQRSAAAPDVPTSAEAGLPELLITPWFGIFAPAGTPEPVLDRLNAAFNAAMSDPANASRMRELGVDIAGGSRQALATFIAAEAAKWAVIIRERRIVAD